MSKKLKMIEKALQMVGINEILGGNMNPKVLALVDNVTNKTHTKNISWCAAFVGSILKDSNYEYSGNLTARAYLKVGTKVSKPTVGDIVILWRETPDSWKGHVGFFISQTGNVIWVLGGNQNNSVCIKAYPVGRVLEYRKPSGTNTMIKDKAE